MNLSQPIKKKIQNFAPILLNYEQPNQQSNVHEQKTIGIEKTFEIQAISNNNKKIRVVISMRTNTINNSFTIAF